MRRAWLTFAFHILAVEAITLPACSGPGRPMISEQDDPEVANPHGCADIYAQNLLPTFEIEIAPSEWSALQNELATWMDRQAAGLDIKPYHPLIAFKYGDEVVQDAYIKLQGNPSSHWNGEAKMQFTVSFKQVNKQGRFHGLRKIVFHAQPNDVTLLRERLALSYLRLMDIPAPCENNSRLIVNGKYYGVYANREDSDDEYIERVFGHDNRGGDLWKEGVELDNHDAPLNAAGHDALMQMSSADLPTMQRLVDMDATLAVWAAEAMLPDDDGYWAVNHNFYIYDHPTRGFVWLPYDMDATFDFVEFSADPILWVPWWSKGWGVHQQAVMANPALMEKYVAALQRAYDAYDVDLLKSRLERWADQIAPSVSDDQVKPFTDGAHQTAVAQMDNYLWLRKKFVGGWLQCYQSGQGQDSDGDGFVWCRDCNDRDAAMNPNAVEICGNDVDENCNGRKDDCP